MLIPIPYGESLKQLGRKKEKGLSNGDSGPSPIDNQRYPRMACRVVREIILSGGRSSSVIAASLEGGGKRRITFFIGHQVRKTRKPLKGSVPNVWPPRCYGGI